MRKVAPFRIALRGTDDGWWVGMMAPVDSMENAIELGRIRLGPAKHNEAVRKAFIEVLKMIMTDLAKARGLGVADWQTQNADAAQPGPRLDVDADRADRRLAAPCRGGADRLCDRGGLSRRG